MKDKAYYEKVNIENELKLRELLQTLPHFCKDYVIGIEPTTSSRTRIAYAYDLRIFFEYMHENNPVCKKMEISDFPLDILDQICAQDIEEYLNWLKYYIKDDIEHTNNERGISRKSVSYTHLVVKRPPHNCAIIYILLSFSASRSCFEKMHPQ